MSGNRDSTHSVPSVMARLMGLDEVPIERSVPKKSRVLSENYLLRVSSIGIRKKCSELKLFKLDIEQPVQYNNALQVLFSLRTKKHPTVAAMNTEIHSVSSDVFRLGHLAMSKSSRDLHSLEKIQNGVGVYSSGERYVDDKSESWRLAPNSRINFMKPSPGKINEILISPKKNLSAEKKERKRSSNVIESVRPRFRKERTKMVGQNTEPRCELRSNNHLGKETELRMPSSSLSDKKRRTNNSVMSYMSMETKKQVTERWKTTKRFKHIDRVGRSESRSRSPLAVFNAVEIPNFKPRQESVASIGYMSAFESINSTRNDSRASNNEKYQLEPLDCMISEEEHSSLRLGNALHLQEMPYETCDGEESVSSQCSFTDPDSLISFEETYQPSPNSVLDRLGKKHITSDCFKTVNSSLHELQMQLELLKSSAPEPYSEGSSMIVSSDDEESTNESDKNRLLWSPLSVKECRDFSYLVHVLTEADLQSEKCYDKDPIRDSVFETLEKKYGDGICWKRSERKLLFDRIKSGLRNVLDPLKGTLTLTKSVAKRVRFSRGNDMAEKLWALLVSKEEEVSREREKILGKEDGWMELGDEIQEIGREIEDFLIDELVADVSF